MADQAEFIAQRLKEIEKAKLERVTGDAVIVQHDAATGETLEFTGDYWPHYHDYDPA